MVNYGLVRQQTFEEVARQVELDDFNKSVPKPQRVSKFVLESMELSQIDPNHEEEIMQFEKRQREQELRKKEIERVSQERGVSRSIMEHAMREPPPVPQVNVHDDGFEGRIYANTLEQAVQNFYAAAARTESVRRLGIQTRQEIEVANTASVRGQIEKVKHLVSVETAAQREKRLAALAEKLAPREPLVVNH